MTDASQPVLETPAPTPARLDIQEIFKIIPHRYPFLLIDRVVELIPQ